MFGISDRRASLLRTLLALSLLASVAVNARAQPNDAVPPGEAAAPDAAAVPDEGLPPEAVALPPAAPAAEDAAAENAAADDAAADPPLNRPVGQLIRIPAPITSTVDARIRRAVRAIVADAKAQAEWPTLIFQIQPGHNDYGKALDLAGFISTIGGATTVAYVPETVTGHSVLLALACENIAMAEDADLGSAGIDEEAIGDAMRSQYLEIAGRRRNVPPALVLGLLDPALEVWQVETEVSREFVLTQDLEELKQRKNFVLPDRPLKPAGEQLLLSGARMRDLLIADYLAPDAPALVQALGLPPEAAVEDLSLQGDWQAVQVAVKGPITSQLAGQVQGVIQEEVLNGANFILLRIDSPGGSPQDSVSLANFLAGPELEGRRTVAFVPSQALADSALIALACDEIIVLPEAVMGGEGAYQVADDELADVVAAIKPLARARARSWSLIVAMFDPNLTVHRYTNATNAAVGFFSAEELQEQPAPEDWQQAEEVTRPGRLFRVTGAEAKDLRLATDAVENFAELKALYGLEDDPLLIEPGWADFFIDALASPGVAWFLLLIGGVGLYIELQAPGVGLGGFVAAVCFLLFFWAMFLGGKAGWLEVILFTMGLICLLLEIFVLPGFGIFGIGGGLLMVTSLVLATQTFRQLPRNSYQFGEMRDGMLVVAGAAVGIIALVAALNRFMPRAPGLNRMVLEPPSLEEQAALSRRESLADFSHLLGHEGTVVAQLTPAGKARFAGQLVDVISEGELVPRGARVVVVEARGNRIVVRSLG